MDADTSAAGSEPRLGDRALAPRRRQEGRRLSRAPSVYLREARDGAKRRLVGLVGDEPVPIRHGAPLVDSEKRKPAS